MLNYIKNLLPKKHNTVANVIYQIADTRELREQVKYNGELDQFEISYSSLLVSGINFNNQVYFDTNIEGTPIYYKTDFNNNFCFWLK